MLKHLELRVERLLLTEHILVRFVNIVKDTAGNDSVVETIMEVKSKVRGFTLVAHD